MEQPKLDQTVIDTLKTQIAAHIETVASSTTTRVEPPQALVELDAYLKQQLATPPKGN
jgi:hypothetical protein